MNNDDIRSLDKKKKMMGYAIKCISIVVWLALTRLCVYSSLHGQHMLLGNSESIHFTYAIAPYLFIAGLYGYLIALFSFFIAFVTTLIINMESAYNMAIFLVALMCFSLFSQYFWFMTKKKTFLAALYTLMATSLIELVCITVLTSTQYSFSQLWEYKDYFYRDAAVIFGTAFLLHLYFTKAKDIYKLPFPIAVGYTKSFQENSEIKRSLRKTVVSVKITALIIAMELILGIGVAVFMVALFPDMKHMIIGSIREHEGPFTNGIENKFNENASESENIDDNSSYQENLINGVQNLSYRFDESVITYDIKMILLMLCLGVPMAGFANFYTKIRIGGPLGVMSDFMYDFANADDEHKLEVGRNVDKINIRTNDEISVVYNSMRSTVYSIEDYIGRLKAKQELEKELEVAQKASEAKSSFLSNMSHEIRTPINAVLGMNEMIIRECDDDQILEYANNVKSAGNSLLGIINDILDFSKIEAGKMDILDVEYNLGSTINDLINMISVKAADKGLELEVNVDEKTPASLKGDEIRIKQCVTNVLTNAVKYTEKGKVQLNVSYRKLDDKNIMLGFQVVDTGIGIKEEDLNKLFSPFERIEEIRNRSVEGTGLGMSIVKKLLAMMDSRLEVKSVYGEGSDFSFEVKQEVTSWDEIGDFKKKYKEYLQKLEKYHESFHAPDAEILVVDDTPMNLMVVKGLLKSTLIKVDTAESGRETLEKITKKHYDVIFIDHRMPEMDGIETLAAMKSLEGNLNFGVPCIALTANAGDGAREQYVEAGFDDYLAKPINGELMEDMLRMYLDSDKVHLSDGKADDSSHAADDGKASNVNSAMADDIQNTNAKSTLVTGGQNSEKNSSSDNPEGINMDVAIANCGDEELAKEVILEFYNDIDNKAFAIEEYYNNKDYKNYTVQVHSLKSSARIIGAEELSKKAEYLEKCGDGFCTFAEKTDELLILLRSYKEKLKPDNKEKKITLAEIPEDQLLEAYSNMKELLEAFDFDSAESIFHMLDEYSIPDKYKEKHAKLNESFSAFDRESLLKEL